MVSSGRRFGPMACMALTLGSAVLWGLAHLATGRRRTGLMLLSAEALLILTGFTLATFGHLWLLALAVQSGWLTALTTGLLALGLGWAAIVVRSHFLLRPAEPSRTVRLLGDGFAALLCVLVIVPLAYAARVVTVSRDVMQSVFAQDPPAPTDDPWNGRRRVNILLLGADAAANRYGVRTDSMTLATIHLRTGRTVLFSLPRNLMHPPMPPGPARDRFPAGFTGEGPHTPGILNEVYQYAEDHPEVVPHARPARRGPTLIKRTIGGILGLHVHYYAMVDMKGFAEIIDAMGGVTITVRHPIVYGLQNEGRIPAGTRKLSGEAALWFGRSRTESDDYVRMGRQRCLLNAVARQADPATVLRGFDRLARAARRTVSTDIPQSLLPALLELSQKVKGSEITSLQFVPPLIDTGSPDYTLIRRKVVETLAGLRRPTPSLPPRARPAAAHPTPSPTGTVSLDAICE